MHFGVNINSRKDIKAEQSIKWVAHKFTWQRKYLSDTSLGIVRGT